MKITEANPYNKRTYMAYVHGVPIPSSAAHQVTVFHSIQLGTISRCDYLPIAVFKLAHFYCKTSPKW